jgi:tetratricopeptide (TPR) repeat protein
MSERPREFEFKGRAARLLAAAGIVLTILLCWFSVRWQVGNMLGEVTSPGAANVGEVAELAKRLSPYDPAARWLLATASYDPAEESAAAAYAESLKDVVRLSPEDYRWWIELGRAYEQAGRADLAREALLRAVEFNPNYTYPSWQYGNFELRRGEADAAVSALIRSARTSGVYREQVFPVLWDYFERDAALLDGVAAGHPELLAGLTKFYASRELADEALAAWRRMSDADRERNRAVGALVAQALFEKRYFGAASEFVRSLGLQTDVAVGALANGGFENEFADGRQTLFGWYPVRRDKVELKEDQTVKKSGRRSLRMTFKGFSGTELANLFQVFAVEPGTTYRLTFWLRTEGLRSEAPVTVDVAGINAADLRKSEVVPGTVASVAFPGGTAEWREESVEFSVPDGVQGLQIRFNRVSCGADCPIVGTLWADDFVLVRIR